MSYTRYQDMPYKLTRREPFKGNSASARWNSQGGYEVRSYGTVIATYRTGEGWNIPEEYHSRTTSRLQNLVRRIA